MDTTGRGVRAAESAARALFGLGRPPAGMGHAFEDPDSNVFHKAIVFDPGDGAGRGILTIGAVSAHLKTLRPAGESLSATTIRHGRFGGRFDRLREVEIGDVTGDGEADIAIATHDQGIVTGE